MSVVLYRLGHWCFRHRWRVVAVWLAVLVTLGGLAGLLGRSYDDNFDIPGAASQASLTKLRMTFPEAAALSATAIIVLPEGHTTDEPAVRSQIARAIASWQQVPQVQSATSPFDEHVQGLVSKDRRSVIVPLQLKGKFADVTADQRQALQDRTRTIEKLFPAGTEVRLGGEAFSVDVPSLSITEGFGVLVALLVLVLTFGSLVAAGLPLLTAVFGVGLSMTVITIATGLAPINSTTPMLAVMLGLAVGIDYALFIASRHRDQLGQGMDAEESAARSVGTAGSAVVFAGLTVIIALAGMGVAGIPFLTVMGAFAAVAVALAVLIALTLVPALMGFLGRRLAPRASRTKRAASAASSGRGGVFGWWVRVVTKVPVLTIAVVVAALGVLSVPAKDLWLALPNSGQHSETQPDRQTYDLIAQHFGPGHNGPLIVTVDLLTTTDPLGVMAGIKADIEKIPGVSAVPLATPNRNADTGFVQVVPTTGPDDPRTADLVRALTAQHGHWLKAYGVDTQVTGSTAIQLDISARLARALVPFGLLVVGLSLLLLTMVFRSIAVPIKATVGYLLSIGAAFGATNLVFNRGRARQVINLDTAGPVISFLPIIAMGILFGLAMDYEVFLVSRMREYHVHGMPAREAVRAGFVASGKVVAAAAVIMVAVFAFFVPEGMGPIKQIAFALAVGVSIDAFLVRMTLVPAVLHLLGERAWWLPGWLDRWLPSFDVEGEGMVRQLALADWPETGRDDPLVTDQLTAGDLFAPLSLRVRPGQVAVLTGDAVPVSAALLAVGGRLRTDGGRGRVAGHLLDNGHVVRAAAGHLDASRSRDVVADLAALTAEAPPLVTIDHVDRLTEPEQVVALQRLIDAVVPHGAAVLGARPDAEFDPWRPDLTIRVEPGTTDGGRSPATPPVAAAEPAGVLEGEH